MGKQSEVKRKISKKDIFFIITFLIGIFILTAPIIISGYYEVKYKIESVKFDKKNIEKPDEEKREYLRVLREYNNRLKEKDMREEFSKEQLENFTIEEKEGYMLYQLLHRKNELLCYVKIPKIKSTVPVYAGATDANLKKGGGHLEGSSLPIGGKGTNCVIAAHRGLGDNRLFRDLDKMKKGDTFFINNATDEIEYRVVDTYVVEPNDYSKLLVEPGKEYCSLLTCTPYLSNNKRMIVRGERVKSRKKEEKIIKMELILILLSLLIISAVIIGFYRKRKKPARKNLKNSEANKKCPK